MFHCVEVDTMTITGLSTKDVERLSCALRRSGIPYEAVAGNKVRITDEEVPINKIVSLAKAFAVGTGIFNLLRI